MKLILCFFLFTFQYCLGQVAVYNADKFDDLKKGTLYVYAGNLNSQTGKAMRAAIRSAWNISKIEFLDAETIPEKLKVPGNYFATVDHSATSFQYMRDPARGTGEVTFSEVTNNDYYYFNFWSVSPKKSVARAELYYKSMGQDPELLSTIEHDPAVFLDDYFNGTVAQVRNIFQLINNSIRDNDIRRLKEDMHSTPGLARLNTDTLYVPNIWFGPSGTQMPEGNKFYNKYGSRIEKYIRNMMDDYQHPIRLIRRDELNNMIMSSTKPIYYFNYIQSSADKMVSVVNGLTGEVVYFNFARKAYRPNAKDFRNLSEAISAGK